MPNSYFSIAFPYCCKFSTCPNEMAGALLSRLSVESLRLPESSPSQQRYPKGRQAGKLGLSEDMAGLLFIFWTDVEMLAR
jgi:hypothetical protein